MPDAAGRDSLTGERRGLGRALALLAGLEVALFLLCALPGNALQEPFQTLFAVGASESLLPALRREWAGGALFGAALALFALALVAAGALGRHRPALEAALLLTLQAASQLLLLRGLVPTDETAHFRSPPAILEELPRDAVLAHGGTVDMFVKSYPMSPNLPDRRSLWLWRRAQEEAFGFAGVAAGRRYELNISAEGLDSFLEQAVAIGMRQFEDPQRVAILAATGVDVLLLPRPLALAALDRVELLQRTAAADPLYVYRIREALADAQLVGDVRFAASVNAGLEQVFAPGFDPRRAAVVAGEGAPRQAPGGEVRLERFAPEQIELAASSSGGGFVVLRRAWLPTWRVEVDGAPAKVRIADLTRLAVEVGPGEHRVRFWIDRRPLRAALAVSLAALVALVAAAARRRTA